jgi:cytochrome b561
MLVRNTSSRWGPVSQLLHWVVVALVITQLILGPLAAALPLGMHKLAMLARHKSIGITILMLAIVRLLWRALSPAPQLPVTLAPYERKLARFTHAALYALLFILPLSGWIMSSARNFAVSWFGLFQLPDLVSPDRHLYEFMVRAHLTLAWVLGIIAALHALAALRHHFILKDDVLRRMLPAPARDAR